MRELKFRCWNWKSKQLIYSIEKYMVSFFDGYFAGDNFEQFTGLLDRNGKEIYEGDIIKVDSDKLMIPHEHTTKASEVFYSNYQTAFVYRTWYGEIPVGRHDTSVEVIGNIHENPELLGGKNASNSKH